MSVEVSVGEADVQAALTSDQGSQATLVSWVAERFTSKFDGATSNIANIRVKYQLAGRDKEVCYVLKENRKPLDFFHLIFVTECSFYGQVLPALNSVLDEIGEKPLSFPKCIHYSLEKGKEMIFLENLRGEAGYKMEDRARGVGESHASLVLKEVSRLHAASFLLQARLPHDLLDEFTFLKTEWTKEFNLGSDWTTYMQGMLELHTEIFEKMGGCDKVVAWIKKIRPQVGQLYDKLLLMNSPFATITHGDCWINNMLFRYDDSNTPVEVKFLDMQGSRKASVALDLQHFLTLNVVDEVRRPGLTSLLATYHTSLTRVMQAAKASPPFTLDQLRQEYIDKGFYGVLYGVMWLPNMVKTEKDATDILDSSEDGKKAERDCVLRMVDNNPLLKSRLLSVTDEWTEYGLIS